MEKSLKTPLFLEKVCDNSLMENDMTTSNDLGQTLQELQAELKSIGADHWVDPYTAIYDTAHAVKILTDRLRRFKAVAMAQLLETELARLEAMHGVTA